MVENRDFIEYGIEGNQHQELIQLNLLDKIVLVTKKRKDLFYFIEFLSVDGLAEVWHFTDNNERILAYEYALLSFELHKVINKIHAKLN